MVLNVFKDLTILKQFVCISCTNKEFYIINMHNENMKIMFNVRGFPEVFKFVTFIVKLPYFKIEKA